MTKQLKFLTKEQKRQWDEDGFIKVGNIFTPAELTEIDQAYDDLFERKARENANGLEAGWVGDEMKKAAKNIDYTVSLFYSCLCSIWFQFKNIFQGQIHPQSANAQWCILKTSYE